MRNCNNCLFGETDSCLCTGLAMYPVLVELRSKSEPMQRAKGEVFTRMPLGRDSPKTPGVARRRHDML